MILEEEDKDWIHKKAKEEGVKAQLIYDALSVTQENIGDGYIFDFLWDRGASQLVEWYKQGVAWGKASIVGEKNDTKQV